jgi:DNA ligase (NAD+)
VGEVVARSISEHFQRPEEQRFLERLAEAELHPMLPAPRVAAASGPFAGKRVVFTGALELRSREEAEALVRSLGGSTSSSVSAKTDLLVAGPKAGSKLERARQLGVKVVDEETFDAMLR